MNMRYDNLTVRDILKTGVLLVVIVAITIFTKVLLLVDYVIDAATNNKDS